ncbi:hypothetical protein AAIH46_12300 [Rhizobium sp. 0TCS1.26]|uniref:hypothetical protein n=1 Tax=Rhizobium sp. 0TCS1.26 TaxID=3142623 RepID=UPI003D26730A
MQRQMNALEWLMLAALSILWGGSFLFNGILVQAWPPLTILLAALVLGEELELRHLFGLLLVAAGLAAIDGRLWRRLRPARP